MRNVMKPSIFNAIRALAPNSKFVMDGDGTIVNSTLKKGDSLPTKSEIDVKLASMISDWDALAWSRNRAVEYPTIAELTISLFDAGDKAVLVTKRAAVKTKWPKDNSGPVE